jgi:two-component system nitrate/nitrite response regulator NarL
LESVNIEGSVVQYSVASAQPNSDTIRILLADDHTLIAQAVASVLMENGRFTVDTVENLQDAITAMTDGPRYDLVMLDLRMPGVKGLDSLKRVIDLGTAERITLFTANADRHIVKRAIELGVHGVIQKTMPLNSLESVLRLILSGQTFLPSSVIEAPANGTDGDDLSEIELLILKFAAEGMTNKSIASQVGLNETTVKMHMRAICRKLKATNRVQAVVIARNNALIDF